MDYDSLSFGDYALMLGLDSHLHEAYKHPAAVAYRAANGLADEERDSASLWKEQEPTYVDVRETPAFDRWVEAVGVEW